MHAVVLYTSHPSLICCKDEIEALLKETLTYVPHRAHSRNVKRLVCRMFIALSAFRSSITHEMLISLAPKTPPVQSALSASQWNQQAQLTLRNHLDVDPVLAECREHLASNTNHVLHLRSHQTQNGHLWQDTNIPTLSQILHSAVEIGPLRVAHMNSNRHMDLARRDKIYRDLVLIENGEYTGEKGVSYRTLVRMNIYDSDLVLDGNSRRPLWFFSLERIRWLSGSLDLLVGGEQRVRLHNGAIATRVLDILDPNRNRRYGLDDLVHGQMVYDLGAVERQLGSLGGCYGRDQPRSGNFGRVRGEDAIHLLPDLQFICLQAHGHQRCAEIRVPSANVSIQQTPWYVSKEAGHDRHTVLARQDLVCNGRSRLSVKHSV